MSQLALAKGIRFIQTFLRTVRDRVPHHLPVQVSRRLIKQANAARDARLYEVAAALFEEALRFAPGNSRIHIQAGHMFKEARQFADAEHHYQESHRLMPDNPDLAMQLGHFYKLTGRAEEAEVAYGEALVLRPDWIEASDELDRLRSSRASLHSAVGALDDGEPDWVIPELLPRGRSPGAPGEMFRLFRLGASRIRSRESMLKVLRGIEAIRGFCIASPPVERIEILIDGSIVITESLEPLPISGFTTRQKYVFNLWYNFETVTPGRRELTLRLVGARGKVRSHSEYVMVLPLATNIDYPASDAFVPVTFGDTRPIDEQVNTLPTMVRSARRTPLPDIKSILVQRVDQLGDLVCSMPAIDRLRELFPNARIVGLLTSANAGLAGLLGLFDEIVIADFAEHPIEKRRTMPAASQTALRRELAAHNFDLAIDLGEGSESRPLLLLSGARFLYGFKEREWPWLSAGFEMNTRDPLNALEVTPPSRKMVAMVESLGAMQRRASPRRLDIVDTSELSTYGIRGGRPFAVLHTGARLAYSRWPGYPALAQMLLDRTQLDVLVMTDHMAESSQFTPSDRLQIINGKLPFRDFDAILASCSLFVGNDSGPKHMAALRGAKVISLHMARLNWSEWGQEMGGVIMSRRVPCAGCAIATDAENCGKNYACLRRIRPEEVFDAALDLLDDRDER